MAQNISPEHSGHSGGSQGVKHNDDSVTIKDNHAVSKR